MTNKLSSDEKEYLLKIARQMIVNKLKGEKTPDLGLEGIPPNLLKPGACFVTLTKQGELRGCVGSIEASQPLIVDVCDRAISAAFEDPRFPPLAVRELEDIQIEISTLSKPEKLPYESPDDLPHLLRPGVDGVILKYQYRRATFLPQVWEKLPQPGLFLSRLCQKMGLPSDSWQTYRMDVEVYQVEKFSEGDFQS